MRLPYLVLFITLGLGWLADWAIFAILRRYSSRRWYTWAHLVISALVNIALLIVLIAPERRVGNGMLLAQMWMLYAYLTVYIPKYIFLLISAISFLPRLWKRRQWVWLLKTGGIVAALVFATMWWGALIDRNQIQIKERTVVNPTLPKAFDGLKIAQISDLHVGTYGSNPSFLISLVEEVNGLHPDLILFTGDIVNRNSEELEPFVETLAGLSAPLGVYAVLGNHDYGDYSDWPSSEAKAADHQALIDMERRMGWQLLNNATAPLALKGDTLMLIGVENIGEPPFKVYGNLREAYPGNLADSRYKVLMSHNPQHWDDSIAGRPGQNIALTLSGHTHAMQMEALGWSPSSWRYPHWGGLYADSLGRQLNVNIGTGTVGFPARIGATPEITLLTLRRE